MGFVGLWTTIVFFVSAKHVCGTSSCPTIENMAAGRSAEVKVGSTRAVIDQQFSDLPYFTYWDALKATSTSTCVPADPTLNYTWTVDIQATGLIAYAVVLSNDQNIGNETFLLEFSVACCDQNFTQSICYPRCESLSVVQVTQPPQLYPYYAHQMTCHDQNVTGRGVRISKRAESPQATSVCGVKVVGCLHDEKLLNMAEGKPASQSSKWGENVNAPASLAVDGSRNQNFMVGDPQCTHTIHGSMTDVPKWWCVDIGHSVAVSHVLIYNRNGANGERLRDFTLEVGQDDEQGDVRYTECYYHNGSADSVTNVTCRRPMCGRYVRVMKSQEDTDALTLCEVEVYATAALQMSVDDTVQMTTSGSNTNIASASSDTASTGVTTQTTRVDTDTYTSHTEATESETNDPKPTETATYSDTSSTITTEADESATETKITDPKLTVTDAYPDTSSTKTTEFDQPTTHLTDSSTENSPTNSTHNGPRTNAVTTVTESTDSDQSSTLPANQSAGNNTYPSSTHNGPTTSACQGHNLPKCRCLHTHLVQNSTLLEAQADKKAKEIAKALAVDRSSTAMYLRGKISASDDRPSAKMAGFAAVVVLTVVAILVMFGDVPSVLMYCVRMLKRRSGRVTTCKD